jgi:monoamine oxidase
MRRPWEPVSSNWLLLPDARLSWPRLVGIGCARVAWGQPPGFRSPPHLVVQRLRYRPSVTLSTPETLDLAVVGAGVAGSYVAYRAAGLHRDWSIALFERTERVGGRLYSSPTGIDAGLVELGGMRFRAGHVHVAALVDELGLLKRPFATGHPDNRLFLRGRSSRMADDGPPPAYDLAPSERGLSVEDLVARAFDTAVPGAEDVNEADWVRIKREHTYRGRLLRDWRLDELFRAALSEEAAMLIHDAFGYMSGIGPHNAADAIPYLFREATPIDDQLTLADGMDRLPQAMAERFSENGGQVLPGHQLSGFDAGPQGVELVFVGGQRARTRRLVLALPRPAVDALADGAPFLSRPDVRRLVESTTAYPALKLYLWYDRPWWRDDGFAGHRMTTDLPLRKTFYLDSIEASDRPGPALLLAAYGDGTDLDAWRTLDAAADAFGHPTRGAPEAFIREADGYLAQMHGVKSVPKPIGSAMRYWGADPRMAGWHYWATGADSADVKERITKPDPSVPVYLCGEAWSTAQAWIEGALESAEAVVDRLAG